MTAARLIVIEEEWESSNAPTFLQKGVRIDGQRQQMTKIGEPVWKRGNFARVSIGAIRGHVGRVPPTADEPSRAGNDCK